MWYLKCVKAEGGIGRKNKIGWWKEIDNNTARVMRTFIIVFYLTFVVRYWI